MNGKCDICKVSMEGHKQDPSWLYGSMYCDTCKENEKRAIYLRQELYRKIEELVRAKESVMALPPHFEDLDFEKHHRFINRR